MRGGEGGNPAGARAPFAAWISRIGYPTSTTIEREKEMWERKLDRQERS
jgi:hypothetical protein